MNHIVLESWKKKKKSVNSCGESRLIGLQPAKHSKVGQGRLDKRLKHSGGGGGGGGGKT